MATNNDNRQVSRDPSGMNDTQIDFGDPLTEDVVGLDAVDVRIVLRQEATITDVTQEAYPLALEFDQVVVIIDEATGRLEEVVLRNCDRRYHLRDNCIGVSAQYADRNGTPCPEVRYVVLKPQFRPTRVTR